MMLARMKLFIVADQEEFNGFGKINKRITPKNLRTASRPPGPSIRSIKLSDFNTANTMTRLTKMPSAI